MAFTKQRSTTMSSNWPTNFGPWSLPRGKLPISLKHPLRRHTYATQMLMAGMNHAFCAKQLGHSVEMFQRTYSKWIDGQQDDAEMGRLEAALCPANAQKQNKAS